MEGAGGVEGEALCSTGEGIFSEAGWVLQSAPFFSQSTDSRQIQVKARIPAAIFFFMIFPRLSFYKNIVAVGNRDVNREFSSLFTYNIPCTEKHAADQSVNNNMF